MPASKLRAAFFFYSSAEMACAEFDLQKFQADYKAYGPYALKKQIPHLAALAEKYLKKYQSEGEDGGDWRDCLKVRFITG